MSDAKTAQQRSDEALSAAAETSDLEARSRLIDEAARWARVKADDPIVTPEDAARSNAWAGVLGTWLRRLLR